MSSRKEYIGKLTGKVNTQIVIPAAEFVTPLPTYCTLLMYCTQTERTSNQYLVQCMTSLPAPSGKKSLNALISLMPVILPCNAIFVSYIFDLYKSVRCEGRKIP